MRNVYLDKTSSLCIHLISDRWVGVHQTFETSILEVNMLDPKNFEGENVENLYSQVSDKPPLPLSTVGDALLEMIFGERLQYFNPVQSQVDLATQSFVRLICVVGVQTAVLFDGRFDSLLP